MGGCALIFFLIQTPLLAASESIIWDREHGVVRAPAGHSYEWYLNGEIQKNTAQHLEVNLPGVYQVKYTHNGQRLTKSIEISKSKYGKLYRIWTIGDSTVQDWDDGWAPKEGWGAVLHYFFNSETVEVINRAVGGTSSKSFYEKYWREITDELQSGDFVFIQFGINDRADDDRKTDPGTTFKTYLNNYIEESREKGAYPVIVSTLRRHSWNSDNKTVYDSYGGHARAARELARTAQVPLIDLDSLCKVEMEEAGKAYVGPFWYMYLAPGEYSSYPKGQADQVHLQKMGAIQMAKMVVKGIELNRQDPLMNALHDHFTPTYALNVSVNVSSAALITRSESYPAGIPLTIKILPKDTSYVFGGWYDNSAYENRLTLSKRYEFTMPESPVSYFALLDNDKSKVDCAGIYEGDAYLDQCETCVAGSTNKSPCYIQSGSGVMAMKAKHSGLCIAPGSVAQQEQCSGSQRQQWILEPVTDLLAVYRIKNASSGQYLETKGANVVLGTEGTKIRVERLAQDTYQLILHDNLNAGLAIPLKNEESGARLAIIARNNTSAGHLFTFELEPLRVQSEDLIYPNPAQNGQITLSSVEKGTLVTLCTMQGMVVKTTRILHTGDQVIDCHDMTQGMYLLRIIAPDGSESYSKLIINR
ncbi:putative secreted protein (Por secretion system target) [Marinoscillum furvescens DSM 4134]|uniref:Putative secreted protein (Por secretion system target) n=2 Tax=Marinoscillum furvescens TaxID=1026 RepID=A0A3D9LI44_MARFU|nr:putative secreted protein (Por secretion system target) [Marinoscillum furvescens DSM 4134]